MGRPLRTDLRNSAIEGTAASLMVGIGENYLPVFVLAVSGSQLACGLSTTVPLVIGAALQLASPWFLRKFASYRSWLSLCAVIQAAAFVPIVLASFTGRMSVWLAFALIAVYWAMGLGSSGPWNTWIETLVPQRIRNQYFARRTRVCQWGVVVGFAGGGLALLLADRTGTPLAAFAVLFFIAAAARLVSASLLARQREPQPPRSGPPPALSVIWRSLAGSVNGRLLLYVMVAQVGSQISIPYFNPYMLGELHFSYALYVIVMSAAIVAKIVFLPTVGRIADRVGPRRVFWLSAAAIVPAPALWLLSGDWRYLVIAQIYAGMAWCAFDLTTFLLFLETIPRQKRVDVLTVFNLLNAAATAGGSLLGAGLLWVMGANRPAYLGLFVLSTLARAAAILVIVRRPAAARFDEPPVSIPPPHYLRIEVPSRERKKNRESGSKKRDFNVLNRAR